MHINKILCFIVFLALFKVGCAFAVEVDSYDEFIDTYRSGPKDGEINLECNVDMDCNLGCPACDLKIEGNDNTIDGNGCGGIVLEHNRKLSAEGVTMQNFTDGHGAVLNNTEGCSVEKFSGNFVNNFSDGEGGVIYNESSIIQTNGRFENNQSNNNGGAICNLQNADIGSVSGEFDNNVTTKSTGGAICNFGKMGIVNAYFNSNRADEGQGGAIANYGNIDSVQGNYENNSSYISGGAVYNSGSIGSLKGNFTGNSTTETADFVGGGAVFNYGNIDKLSGTFKNNSSNGMGGAIHNAYGTINIVSDEEDVIFSGNSDSTGSNAIHNDSGTINLNASNKNIVVNDKISGNSLYTDAVININSPEISEDNSGVVELNNEVAGNTVNMFSGTLKIGHNNETGGYGNFTDTADFNYFGGTVDLRDEDIHNTNFGNLTLHNNMDLKLDGSFEDFLSDTFTADSFISNGYNIDITDILLMSVTEEKKFTISPIGESIDESVRNLLKEAIVYSAGDVINSPVYRYRTYYVPSEGLIYFERIENDKFNPAVLASAVAAQLGGYLTQLNSYEEAFRRMDMYMLLTKQQRLNLKMMNKYASSDTTTVLTSEVTQYENKCGWIRPYSVLEKVPLKNGPNVSNVAYGTFGGLESDLIELKRGWDLIWGPYIGYNGSHQAYRGNDIYQNGGTVGAVAMAYKGNFYSGATANISSNGCNASTMYGSENFAMLMTGIASKSGYNWELKEGKFIIQPNYLMSYTFVDTFSYKNAAGININTKPLFAVQIAPGVQLMGNYNNGWQPFANAYMVWNILDKAEFKANDVSLPVLSVKPFVLYGVGVRKVMGERFTGFYQTYVTNGGRNGVGINFGLRWKVGN